MAGSRIEVTDKPVKLVARDPDRLAGQVAVIRNAGAEPVDLGDANVETEKGYLLPGETSLPNVVPIGGNSEIHAVAANEKTSVLHVLVV